MKLERAILRIVDGLGCAAGMPHVTMVTKLIEELYDSQRDLLIRLKESEELDKGFLLAGIGAGYYALQSVVDEQHSSPSFAKRRLRVAYNAYHEVYFVLKHRPKYVYHSVEVAKSLSLCRYLMGHFNLAHKWIGKAVEDNISYGYPQQHDTLVETWHALNKTLLLKSSDSSANT